MTGLSSPSPSHYLYVQLLHYLSPLLPPFQLRSICAALERLYSTLIAQERESLTKGEVTGLTVIIQSKEEYPQTVEELSIPQPWV